MTMFWSLLTMGFGLLMFVVALFAFRRKTQLILAFMGMAIMVVGGTYGAAYRRDLRQKAVDDAKAKIKARTVVQRGMVDLKEERWSRKYPAPKNGGYLCLITLKELPYTFALSERDNWNGRCTDIKIRDIVMVSFVQPMDNAPFVDALEFVDLTYELNIYKNTRPPETPKPDQRSDK